MKKGEKAQGAQTIAEVIETAGVPLWVRLWLERYASGDEYVLEPNGLHNDPATEQIARLVYDVLYTDSAVQFAEIDDAAPGVNFPAEARDFIEGWMYSITTATGDGMVQPWSNPDMAVMALPLALDTSAGSFIEFERDPTLAMLRTAMRALTTKAERRAFLRDTDETDAEPEKESTANWRAAWKLSRVLADPRTPAETRDELGKLILEFSMSSNVTVEHPALVRRAFLLMCEAKPKGKVRECKKDRRTLLALLDTLPEMAEGEGAANSEPQTEKGEPPAGSLPSDRETRTPAPAPAERGEGRCLSASAEGATP